MDRNLLTEWVTQWEDSRNETYLDTAEPPHPTIGVGFNLDKAEARELIEGLGLNYNDVRSGQVALNDEQIGQLLQHDLDTALSDARHFVPNFDELPPNMQMVVTDMAFNLGADKLSGFVELREALIAGDVEKAAVEMRDSHWYGQVGAGDDQRGGANVNLMLHGFPEARPDANHDQSPIGEPHSFNNSGSDTIMADDYAHDLADLMTHEALPQVFPEIYSQDNYTPSPGEAGEHGNWVELPLAPVTAQEPFIVSDIGLEHPTQVYLGSDDSVGSTIEPGYGTHEPGQIIDIDPGILDCGGNDQLDYPVLASLAAAASEPTSFAPVEVLVTETWGSPVIESDFHGSNGFYAEPAMDVQQRNFEVVANDPPPADYVYVESPVTVEAHSPDWVVVQTEPAQQDQGPTFSPVDYSLNMDTHTPDSGTTSDTHGYTGDSSAPDSSGGASTSDSA